MSKIVKIILGLIFATLIATGVIAYLVSQKINPEEIKKLIKKGVSDAMPATEAELEQIDYSLGLSVKMYLKQFELNLKADKTKLFSVGEVELKVPIWAILSGGGTVEVSVKKPNAYYKALNKDQTNWDLALPKSNESAEKKSDVKNEKDKKLELPSFVTNSRVNIKVEGLNLEYLPFQQPPANINVSKIVFKNINLKSSTAFEIRSKIVYPMDPSKTFVTNLQMIGEIDIGKILNEKKIAASVVVNLSETSLTGLEFKIPDVENKIKIVVLENGEISTEMAIKASHIAEANIKTTLGKDKLLVEKFELVTFLSKLGEVLPRNLLDKMTIVDLGNSQFSVDGTVEIGLNPLKVNPDLAFEVKEPVVVKLEELTNISSTFKGNIRGKNVAATVFSELFSGSVTTTVTVDIDPLNMPSSFSEYPKTKVDVNATNIKLSRKFLQDTIYSGKKDNKEADATVAADTADATPAEPVEFPPVALSLEGKKISIADEVLEFHTLIDVAGNQIVSDDFNILFGKGTTNIKFKTTMIDSKNIDNNFSVKLTNMNMSALNSLLPPFISQIEGFYEGNVTGNLGLLEKGLTYKIAAQVSARDGEFKNLNVKEIVTGFVDGIKDKFPKKYEKASNKFDKLVVDVNATEKKVDVKKFEMVGDRKSLELMLKGSISMEEKKSVLFGDLMIADYKVDLKREVGTEKFPLKLSGDGFVLYPEIGYTLERILKQKVKLEEKKVQKTIKQTVKKEEKKLKKKIEDELKKKKEELLKGMKL